jgi:two-component system NarL family response regulator
MIAVMIVTNHPIMRKGLRMRVQQQPDMQVVCETSNPAQTLRDFRQSGPDVVVIDVQSPRGAGRKVVGALRAISSATPLVILTTFPGEVDSSTRPGQGAIRVVSKISASKEVIAAIREVLRR